MFNGIIEETGTVVLAKNMGGGKELTVSCRIADTLEIDNSISINGACQTVVRKDAGKITVQVVEETLRKTTLGDLRPGSLVNLERPLSLNQRIHGHLVQGHVDTTGTLLDIRKEGSHWLCTIEYGMEWSDHIVGRGSIAIDGISLTIARVSGRSFSVAIIPYTWENTIMKHLKTGDKVNLEFDILGKYVIRFLQKHYVEKQNFGSKTEQTAFSGKKKEGGDQEGITLKKLRDFGFHD